MKQLPVSLSGPQRGQSEAGVPVQFGLTLRPLDGAFETFTEKSLRGKKQTRSERVIHLTAAQLKTPEEGVWSHWAQRGNRKPDCGSGSVHVEEREDEQNEEEDAERQEEEK